MTKNPRPWTINLTHHAATPEQLAAGVIEPSAERRAEIARLLTFEQLPSPEMVQSRASLLASMARCVLGTATVEAGPRNPWTKNTCAVMIGGAPFLMAALERELVRAGLTPVYAFSTRESVEEIQPDGSVRKTAIFRHKGFVPAL